MSKKISSKDKDNVLNRIKTSHYIDSDEKSQTVASIILADGFANAIIENTSQKTQYHLTNRGKKFIEEGGYVSQELQMYLKNTGIALSTLFSAIAAITGIIRCCHSSAL